MVDCPLHSLCHDLLGPRIRQVVRVAKQGLRALDKQGDRSAFSLRSEAVPDSLRNGLGQNAGNLEGQQQSKFTQAVHLPRHREVLPAVEIRVDQLGRSQKALFQARKKKAGVRGFQKLEQIGRDFLDFADTELAGMERLNTCLLGDSGDTGLLNDIEVAARHHRRGDEQRLVGVEDPVAGVACLVYVRVHHAWVCKKGRPYAPSWPHGQGGYRADAWGCLSRRVVRTQETAEPAARALALSGPAVAACYDTSGNVRLPARADPQRKAAFADVAPVRSCRTTRSQPPDTAFATPNTSVRVEQTHHNTTENHPVRTDPSRR